jgi:RHS repeat-associated protein
MDRLATRTDPVGAGESFAYDPAGNLLRRVDRKGQVSTFLYDALNRLARSSYADGSGTSFAYDAAGRLVRLDDSTGGTLTNAYDTLDRLLAQSTTLGTVSYQYDALGRRTQLNVPGIVPTTYAYDANSRLTQIVQGTQLVGFEYDDAGRRTRLTLPNGVSTEYQYDLASRLTALMYRNATGVLGDLTYQYDPAGNRTQVGGSFARTLLPNPVASATYDAANRQRLFGDTAITFDANGNLTALTDATQTTRLTWDTRDRLVGVEQPGTLASFAYAFGRRLAKTVNGAAAQFLYDGLDIAQQLEAQRTTSYLRSLVIDETLGLTNPDGAFFFTTDALGSAVAIRDASGSAVTEYTYDTFGAVSATNPAFPNPFQFTGRENDGLAGLYYYRARYYHPGLRRFINEDPIQRAGYGHLYAYVDNNPLRFADPFGLDKCQANAAKPSYPPGTEWLGYYIDFVEKPLGRALIVTGAITSGAVVATAGLVASGAVVAAVPATYGTSLILLPGSLLVVAGGEYLIAFGTDVAINEINGLFATNIPGPHDVNPGLFPRMPPIVNRGCR